VLEVQRGTNPLSGSFRIGLDSSDHLVMAKRGRYVSGAIAHNAFASAADTNGDGTSVEEILEAMPNVGDVSVSRGPVNLGGNSGGYSWLVTFLRDADSPCQEKDASTGLCNSPGNVPKFDANLTDASSLLGTRIAGAVSVPSAPKTHVQLAQYSFEAFQLLFFVQNKKQIVPSIGMNSRKRTSAFAIPSPARWTSWRWTGAR
jgi:hypothetical protein